MPQISLRLVLVPVLATAILPRPVRSQDLEQIQIGTVEAGLGVYMLTGSGGNIGLSVGPDGAFLVDDQLAPLTDKIKAAVGRLTDQPVRFVINTHWHPDHTGGNERMGEAGAIIVAHANTRKRMTVEEFIEALNLRVPPSPPGALPVITFADSVTFHWNGDEIRVFHVDPAHTDGDAIIHFTRANVIHAGDTFFSGMYPFVDLSTGGSIDGVIAATERILTVANPRTAIIPGHGSLSDVAGLRAYRDMLVAVRTRILTLVAQGKNRAEVIAAAPTKDFDATWGNGFLKPEQFVDIMYAGLRSPTAHH